MQESAEVARLKAVVAALKAGRSVPSEMDVSSVAGDATPAASDAESEASRTPGDFAGIDQSDFTY